MATERSEGGRVVSPTTHQHPNYRQTLRGKISGAGREIMRELAEAADEHGNVTASNPELCTRVGVCAETVRRRLGDLVRLGLIEYTPGTGDQSSRFRVLPQ